MLSVGRAVVLGSILAVLMTASAMAADCPMWGYTTARNRVAPDEKNLPVPSGGAAATEPASPAAPADKAKGKTKAAPSSAEEPRGIKWKIQLGGNAVSTPAIVDGRVFIGSNEWAAPGESRSVKSGGGAILCLEEATGKLLWYLPTRKMATNAKGFNFDHLGFGVASSPVVEGKFLFLTGNRNDLLCMDTKGQADGNDGPYQDEGRYMAGWGVLPNKPGRFDPSTIGKLPTELKVLPTDGDIAWLLDMLDKPIDSWPQDACCSSPLVVGDYVYNLTANGVNSSHKEHPSPNAPDLVCVDKKTGKLLGVSEFPVGNNVFHGTWSSPSLVTVGEKKLIVWGGGDGYCYANEATPTPSTEPGKPGILKMVWKFDANQPGTRTSPDIYSGYHNNKGCSEILGTPVVYKNRVFCTVGQDTEHGPGRGALSCIDPTKTGDVTQSGKVWQYPGLDRTMGTPVIYNDMVFIADYSAMLHCVDANTGKPLWTYKLPSRTISSPLVADGKVYVGDDGGNVTVMTATAEMRLLGTVKFGAPIHASLVAANGVIYVPTCTTLFAWSKTAP
jgi:outer membrane protein assembly factor BamB